MHKTVVINAVGLTPSLIGSSTPQLRAFLERGRMATIRTILPAVTCSVQATFLTGCYPSEHGIVGNGWYFRDEHEIKFWRQSNALIQRPKIWEAARALDSTFTCANMFWWHNMYSSVDYSVAPRPMHPADGHKTPDIYTYPDVLRVDLQKKLGPFPLFEYWGPGTSISVSRWIAQASIFVDQQYDPTLTLIYLPHLDYSMQRHGVVNASVGKDLSDLDAVCGDLISYYTSRAARIIFVSEYGIIPVSRPVHINRELRQHGLISVRKEQGHELLDTGASAAFAVADHQVAHVYVHDPARIDEVRTLLVSMPGVGLVLDDKGKRVFHLDHPRSGELVAIAEPDAWFTYYYWFNDERAPDYARTVDIHRKPGYDPVELFLDPRLRMPQAKIGWTHLKSRLGFRTLLDVIPLDASLVRGSHGRVNATGGQSPIFLTQEQDTLMSEEIDAKDVYSLILQHLVR